MKFTVIMLASRGNKLFERSVDSVVKQNPDEFIVYIDRIAAHWKDKKRMIEVLEHAFVASNKTKNREEWMRTKIRFQGNNFMRDHHSNHIESFHRAILNAENKWVMICDDDDEMLGNRRKILNEYSGPEVGFIYGDVKLKYPNNEEKVYENKQMDSSAWRNPKTTRIFGHSGTIYNRDAFRQIHPFVNHGYFADWRICYWLLRCGWKTVHVPIVMTFQNVNPNPSPTRRIWYGKWDNIVMELNKIPDEIIKVVKK